VYEASQVHVEQYRVTGLRVTVLGCKIGGWMLGEGCGKQNVESK